MRHRDVSRPTRGLATLLAVALRDQFPHFRNEIVRYIHHRFGGLDSSFVLNDGVLLSLLLVIREYSSHLLFIPSGWKLALSHCWFFLRRLRYATIDDPVVAKRQTEEGVDRFAIDEHGLGRTAAPARGSVAGRLPLEVEDLCEVGGDDLGLTTERRFAATRPALKCKISLLPLPETAHIHRLADCIRGIVPGANRFGTLPIRAGLPAFPELFENQSVCDKTLSQVGMLRRQFPLANPYRRFKRALRSAVLTETESSFSDVVQDGTGISVSGAER